MQGQQILQKQCWELVVVYFYATETTLFTIVGEYPSQSVDVMYTFITYSIYMHNICVCLYARIYKEAVCIAVSSEIL